MKTPPLRLLLLSLLSAAASPLAFAAPAPKPPVAHAHPVKFGERNSSHTVSRDSTRRQVESALGLPASKLSDDVWLYLNFVVAGSNGCPYQCDRLMITFTAGRVSDIKVVNKQAEQIYAARIKARAAEETKLAAK
jgi:hypothetical protein